MSTCKQCKTQFEPGLKAQAYAHKYGLPNLSYCFECNQKRLLCFRNGRSLYQRTCDFTGEKIVSMYAPGAPFKVYKSDSWYSDKWNALDYGREVDFSRPFFEQLKELQLEVPRLALTNINPVNSDFCNMAVNNADCYLIFGGDNNVGCLYGALSMRNRDCVDCDMSNDNELCYMSSSIFNSYNTRFAFDSKDCIDCAFIAGCVSCTDCILCTNLRGKSYCIENKQYSKEEYLQKKKELWDGSYTRQQKNWQHFKGLISHRIVRYAHMILCEDSTGDYLKSCARCVNCYDSSESENMEDVVFASIVKDSFAAAMLGDKSELIYNAISTFGAYNVRFSFIVLDSSDVEYGDFILNSQNIFGCVCLNKAQYCILNKKYSREEYIALRQRVVEHMQKTGEWGMSLPPFMSAFGYNETTAYEYFPMEKEEAVRHGFQWQDNPPGIYGKGTLTASDIADNIADVDVEITKELLTCAGCNKNYKVIKREFDFYKKIGIPIPRMCDICRYETRLKMRNYRKLYHRQCMCSLGDHGHDAICSNEFETTYAPDRPEKVFCEECYQKEVI